MDWENLLGQHKVAKGQIFMMTLQKDKSNLDRSFSSLNVRSLFSILELTFLSTSQKVSMSMECSGILSKKNIQFILLCSFHQGKLRDFEITCQFLHDAPCKTY